MCVCAAKNSDFALVEDAVVIDLSDLNSVTVDVENKVISIVSKPLIWHPVFIKTLLPRV